ncbi:MAG: hypothetical protein LBK42_02050 [Propionibacteriaceae bacterium]|jgi:hypothetical protein|nr:hypothetical protein [Propionibacteriaceae bacterium]
MRTLRAGHLGPEHIGQTVRLDYSDANGHAAWLLGTLETARSNQFDVEVTISGETIIARPTNLVTIKEDQK